MTIDIVTLAQRYSVRPGDLRRVGKNFAIPCICPSRNRDSNPSVILYVEQGSYYCFACSRGGSAVAMVAHAEGISFKEAYKRLREMCGGNIPSALTPTSYQPAVSRATSEWGKKCLAILADNYHSHLMKLSRRHFAWQYLFARGVKEETVRALKIGWTPQDITPLTNGLSTNDLQAIGALTEDGKAVMRRRIIFPVWAQNDVIYMIGRRVSDTASRSPKYLGLRTTNDVAKSPMLFGQNVDGNILVEGIMDAIALIQAGLAERWRIIASLGFDKQHIELLAANMKVGNKLIIALDQDDAGRNFSHQIASYLKSHHPDLSIHIVDSHTLPLNSKEFPALTIPANFKDFGELMGNPEIIKRAFANIGRPPLRLFMSDFVAKNTNGLAL